ncbi:MAG TPA: CoA pyrophosphatase [Thermodesulfobacteriota bacterium]|nr:CoA pyrophosphatase [Thermodesulfobacteriota bacterium]
MTILSGSGKIAALERLLKERNPAKIGGDAGFVHAAVMMILKETEEEFSMLFIKRPEAEWDPFSGHMAFPGGRMSDGDESKLETAMRETREEIGVDLGVHGRILGELDDVNPNNPKARGYIVTPYLSFLTREVPLELDRREVEEAVWVPMEHLRDKRNFKVRPREREGRLVEDYAYNYGPYLIWGMTGRIVHSFLSITSQIC